MMSTEHWAVLGQAITILFAILGVAAVGYLAARELER